MNGKMRFGKDVRGIIFDVDGVLLDSLGIWTDLGAGYVASKGLMPEEGLSETLFSMSMEQGAEYIRSHYLPAVSAAEIVTDLADRIRNFYLFEVRVKPGAGEFMEALWTHGVAMTAATSSPRTHVEAALGRGGILGYLDALFTSEEIGSSKHSPEIYDAAAAHMGLSRNEVCVVEDSLYALETAARAGYRTVGVRDEAGEPDQKALEKTADVYVRDLTELMGLF